MKKLLFLVLVVSVMGWGWGRWLGSVEVVGSVVESDLLLVANEGQWPVEVLYEAAVAGGRLRLVADGFWLVVMNPEGDDELVAVRGRWPAGTVFVPQGERSEMVSFWGGGLTVSGAEAWRGGVWRLADGREVGLAGRNGRLHLLNSESTPLPLQLEGAAVSKGAEGWSLELPWGAYELSTVPLAVTDTAEASMSGGGQLIFGTFLGGGNTDEGSAIAVDEAGNAYVTGYTSSLAFPNVAGGQTSRHGIDVYVAKLQADGSGLDYVIWVNPNPDQTDDEDYGNGIVVDGAGAAYVVGQTKSPVFCEFVGSDIPGYDTSYNENVDAFAFKVKVDGSGFDYCTYLGGFDFDGATVAALDGGNNLYVAGGTWSTDFPTTAGVQATTLAGARDLFVAKLDSSGTNLSYGSYIGGDNQEEARGMVVAEDGSVYVTGWTRSEDYPTTAGAWQETFQGVFDAFVTHLSADASTLLFSSYVGGSDEDRGFGVALAADGVVVTGPTRSADLPTTAGAYDEVHGGGVCGFADTCNDIYVAKLSLAGDALVWGTYIGGDQAEEPLGMGVDEYGRIHLVGETAADNYPVTGHGFDGSYGGLTDGFVTVLTAEGDELAYSSYIGGDDTDLALAVAVGPLGYSYVTGRSRSQNLVVTAGSYDETPNGDYDVYVWRLATMDEAVAGAAIINDSEGSVLAGEPIVFTATVSAGTNVDYVWDFGDGEMGMGEVVTHTFMTGGEMTVTLSVGNTTNSEVVTQTVVVEQVYAVYLPGVVKP
ncbi:MAG TPA: SBBP repeat-containing protein [Anaerolineae bacterium]|nr:SBBP repeat-containing protein [Anaerolineae bacterium]